HQHISFDLPPPRSLPRCCTGHWMWHPWNFMAAVFKISLLDFYETSCLENAAMVQLPSCNTVQESCHKEESEAAEWPVGAY
ncbi:hypothetical protein HGM15179_003865, partial [Zosterops borbonicus]